MKYIVILFMSLGMLCSAQITQTATVNDFIGTWQHQEGNKIFRIFLIEDTSEVSYQNKLIGKFQFIEVIDDIETITFDSGYIGDTDYFPNWIAISGGFQGNEFGGRVEDRSNPNYGALGGTLETELIDNNGVLQLTWKVTKRGLRDTEEPDFNIPTDAVLTKVE